MRRKTRQLKQVALESMTLAVEVFNRPSPIARTSGVMLPLQHALEMLFKAIVYEHRRTLFAKGSRITYSFAECLGILRSDVDVLGEHEAIVAASIDSHRDAVQHHGSAMTEELLYIDAASGLRLFDELLHRVFTQRLANHRTFASRMLPIAANPPRELHLLVSGDLAHIRALLQPGHRRRAEALALLRPYVMSDRAATDPHDVLQPTENELNGIARRVTVEDDWGGIFPGLARLALEIDEGLTYGVRITKEKSAPPVRLIGVDDADAARAVGVVEIDLLKRFPFGINEIAEHATVNRYNTQAIVYLLGLRSKSKCFREITVGKVTQGRYSHDALRAVREAIAAERVEEAREAYRKRPHPKQPAA
jgi:hypothetical protein